MQAQAQACDARLDFEASTFPLAHAGAVFTLSDGEPVAGDDPRLSAHVLAVRRGTSGAGAVAVVFAVPGAEPVTRGFASYAAMRAADPMPLAVDR